MLQFLDTVVSNCLEKVKFKHEHPFMSVIPVKSIKELNPLPDTGISSFLLEIYI